MERIVVDSEHRNSGNHDNTVTDDAISQFDCYVKKLFGNPLAVKCGPTFTGGMVLRCTGFNRHTKPELLKEFQK